MYPEVCFDFANFDNDNNVVNGAKVVRLYLSVMRKTHSATTVTDFEIIISVGEFFSILTRLILCDSVITKVVDVILFRFRPDAREMFDREVFDFEINVDMVL